jgi:hypothetical protein
LRLTESQLAKRIERSLGFTHGLLGLLEADGQVEWDWRYWRITLECEARHGAAPRHVRLAS